MGRLHADRDVFFESTDVRTDVRTLLLFRIGRPGGLPMSEGHLRTVLMKY